jgi:hypothetical protein
MEPTFVKIACGGRHSLGIKEDGTLVQWGSETFGQRNGFRPMKALDIACGYDSSVAIDRETGLAHHWGVGKITKDHDTPPTVKLKAVTAGNIGHFFGLQEDGTLIRWGDPLYTIEIPPGLKLRSISSGISNVLYGIREDGTMVRISRSALPWELPDTEKARFVTGNADFAVAILEDGTLGQWGRTASEPPSGTFISVSIYFYDGQPSSFGRVAAVREDGTVVQWGPNPPNLGTVIPSVVATQVTCGVHNGVVLGANKRVYGFGPAVTDANLNFPAAPAAPVAPVAPVAPRAPGLPIVSPTPKFFETPVPTFPTANGLQTRRSASFNDHQVTILPKGTLLFRGVKSTEQLDDDIMGVKSLNLRDYSSNTCVSPFYAVYFYPFPFADSLIHNYSHYGLYVTTRDITLLCLLSPSTLTRGDRISGDAPITSCDNIPTHTFGCGLIGRRYDACLKPTYLQQFPDVVGTLAIANEDRKKFHKQVKFETEELEEEEKSGLVKTLGTYVFTYLDAGDKAKVGGIPEIVLHPFNRALQSPYTTTRTSLSDFIGAHKEYLNYQPLVVIERDDDAIMNTMKSLTSPTGFTVDSASAPVHAKLNPSTGFFQLVELSDPASLDPSQPFRFERPPTTTTGSGRKTRRFRRGKGKKTRKGTIQ